MDAQTAYRRGWDRCRDRGDSYEEFDKCRARCEKKWGSFVSAWEQGWADAAGSAP